jgi:hypothetical protein
MTITKTRRGKTSNCARVSLILFNLLKLNRTGPRALLQLQRTVEPTWECYCLVARSCTHSGNRSAPSQTRKVAVSTSRSCLQIPNVNLT